MHSILIVDDLASIHEMLEAVIQPIGYHTAFATDGEMALRKIREERFDIVLTDINMKPMDGLALLSQIRQADPNAIVIMMSGFANMQNATQALKLGAFDYLTKPFKVDELMSSIQRGAEERRKRLESGNDAAGPEPLFFSGESEAVKAFSKQLERFAKISNPLLIVGESGCQKGEIAAYFHASGDQRSGPFFKVDARAVEAEELGALLFDSSGLPSQKVRELQGGTLYIANAHALPDALQAPLGDLARDLKGELRLVCSTSQNLESMVEKGVFADSLYFRISSSSISVPPLRDRAEDIPALARAFFARSHLPFSSLSDQALALLGGYRWPGNYGELQEVLAAAAELGSGQTIRESDLPDKLRDIGAWPDLQSHLATEAADYKQRVLRACQGDRAKAAETLSIPEEEL